MAMAFFKNFQLLRLPPIGGPQLAQLGSGGRVQFRSTSSRYRGKGLLLPLIDALGVDVQGTRRGLGRATLLSQAQGLGPESGIITPTLFWLGTVLHDIRKIRPYSIHIYSTTSHPHACAGR
jgi:hypothetical protein